MRSMITLAALVAAALPLSSATAQTMRGYTATSTRLYSGPLRDYPTVRTVRRGTVVNVYGCLRDWTWCDVTYRGNRGWIAGNALRIQYQGRRRGIGAGMGIGVTTFAFGSYWENHYQGRRFYGQRQQWQSQYDNGYRPEWGDREQRQDSESDRNRGRGRDRRQSEGQHGQDLRSDNREIEEQERRARALEVPRGAAPASPYTGVPYRFPNHSNTTAQGDRQAQQGAMPGNDRPGNDRNDSARSSQIRDQVPDAGDPASLPQN